MPEGPELRLASILVNRVCKERTFTGPPVKSDVSKCSEVQFSSPRYAISSRSRGKEVMLTLQCREDAGNRVRILFRFGMSGRFAFTPAHDVPKHAHLQFFTSSAAGGGDGGGGGGGGSGGGGGEGSEGGGGSGGNEHSTMVLSFVDPRRFGSWHVVVPSNDKDNEEGGWGKGRGPDPMLEYPAFRRNVLFHLDSAPFAGPICEVMLNQAFFNGIGNYLRAEVLYRAGPIPPFARARDVLGSLAASPPPPPPLKGNKMATATTVATDLLQLCHDVPQEVVELEDGKEYFGVYVAEGQAKKREEENKKNKNKGKEEQVKKETKEEEEVKKEVKKRKKEEVKTKEEAKKEGESGSTFECWLRCYYQPGMRNLVDHQGRTIWFAGEAGPLAPRKAKSRGLVHPTGRSKKAVVVKAEPLEGGRAVKTGTREAEGKGEEDSGDERGELSSAKRAKGKPHRAKSKINRKSDSRIKAETETATAAKVKSEKVKLLPSQEPAPRLGKRTASKRVEVFSSVKRRRNDEALQLLTTIDSGPRRSLRLAEAALHTM